MAPCCFGKGKQVQGVLSRTVDALKRYFEQKLEKVEQTFLVCSYTANRNLRMLCPGTPKLAAVFTHWKKDGAVYWITFRLADAIPRDKRRAFQEARKLWLKRHPEYWFYSGGASLSSVCIPAKGQ